MKNIITFFILFALSIIANAQNSHEWEEFFVDYCTIEDIDANTQESSYDLLYGLEDNPININTATRDDLESLPFLTQHNVEDILEYIYKHGTIKTKGEYAFITSLDYNQRQLLSFFTYPGEIKKKIFPTLSNITKYGKNKILATGKIPLYTRKGDKNGYQGYQYKHSIKYDFTYGDYLRFGLLGSQDAGEPFFADNNEAGYDFYSFYLMLKKLGKIKVLVLGRYRLNFGMGLIINNNYSYGKMSALTSLQGATSNIRVHASRSDANFMQGAATTINITKGLDASLFFSHRKFDATLNKDGTISSIVTSGYHRTKTEIEKKNNSTNTTFGSNIDFKYNGFNIGATAIYTKLDRTLQPNKSVFYRRYYASGNDFFNISLNYGYNHHKFSIKGETATGNSKAIATLNLFTYHVNNNLDLTTLLRYYSYKYSSLYGRSFSDGGYVQNETGAYFGMTWRATPKLCITAYSDYAYFEWPKYQISQSSHAFDNLIQAIYANKNWQLTVRYKLRLRQKDSTDKNVLIYKTDHRARIASTYNNEHWQFKTQADLAITDYKEHSVGWMITQNISCTAIKNLKLRTSFGYFKTDSYESRVYSYEYGLLDSFFIPSFYGHGIRYTLLANTCFIKNMLLTLKIGTTNYFDRSSIGSSYQKIDHSSATDIEVQSRWTF